jgi:tRNA(Ile)-lysidine synthase
MSLESGFRDYILKNNLFSPKDRLLLAVSGGVDSTALCELCHRSGFNFIIAHCNFQLRGEHSASDEQFVKSLAAQYNVPYYTRSFDTRSIASQQKTSIEETARILRYDWFAELLDKNRSTIPHDQLPKYIITGHHADDNIETVLMHFFRGTGIKGLRGMLPKRGNIVRPLLFARRKEIEDFANLHKLEYVTDHTNFEDAYARNFFRNRIIPLVKEFFPSAEQNVLHNIDRMVELEQIYRESVERHKQKLMEQKGVEVHIPALKLKKTSPLHTITFEIIKDFGFTSNQTAEVIDLLDSETGRYTVSPSHRVIRNRNWLIIAPLESKEAENILIEGPNETVSFEPGVLSINKSSNSQRTIPTDPNISLLDLKDIQFPLLLRKWKAGDYFYPLGMKKKKKLARFLIDLKLSKTDKEKVWVVESNKRILWVIGHRIDERFRITESTKEILELKLITSQK